MKSTKLIVGSLAIVAASTMIALAANVHLVGGLNVTEGATSARVCGKLAGLGNADVTITLTANITVNSTCVNPAGHIAPGHANQTVTSSIRIRRTEIKNGSVSFCVSTAEPVCRTAKACGCPNNNWTADITSVDFNLVELTVEQNGQVVLEETVLD